MTKKEKLLYLTFLSLATLIIALLIWQLGYIKTLSLWKVPHGEKIFIDLRIITASSELYRAGLDPNQANPYFSAFTYPKIFYVVFASGITEEDTIPLGIAMLALLLVSLFLFPGKLRGLNAIVLTGAIFSPAVMLGVDRGNVDLAIFSVTTLALLSCELPWLSCIFISLAAAFKLFPIFGIGYFLDSKKKESLKPILISGAIFCAYFGIMFTDLQHVFYSTAKGDNYSYGAAVLALKIVNEIGYSSSLLYVFFYLIAFLLLISTSYAAFHFSGSLIAEDTRNIRAFRIGAGIFVGTFLLGNNWDYRLTFLIFALPQLMLWTENHEHILSTTIARVALGATLYSLWNIFIYGLIGEILPQGSLVIYFFDELTNWILFASLTYLLIASLPSWTITMFPRLHKTS